MPEMAGFGGRIAAFLVALALMVGAAFAQEITDEEYAAWAQRASVAESTVGRAQASTQAFETLRAEIAGWRERFMQAQTGQVQRIDTLQAQLDTLGPAPEGVPEPDPIAERRAELTEELQRLRAPVLRAVEAHARAEGIITSIDAVIRGRQQRELLEFGPSPLNPIWWQPALADVGGTVQRSWRELTGNMDSDLLRIQLRQNLPLIIGLAALGMLLIVKGPGWAQNGVNMLRGAQRRGAPVWRFLLSLGQIAVPLVGIYALTQAATAVPYFGARWTSLLEGLPTWAIILLGSRWLAGQLFNSDDEIALLPLDPEERASARRIANILSVLLVARSVLETLNLMDGYGPGTQAVTQFPLLVLSGLLLARFGRLRLRSLDTAKTEEDLESSAFRRSFSRFVARASIALGVAGPVLAAIGYLNIGEFLVYPAIFTLALIAAVMVLQSLAGSLYTLATKRASTAEDSLIPVLVSLLLSVAALPVLALIWGARVADLTELWTRFQDGFIVGETRFQPTDFIVVVVVFLLGYTITRMVQGALRTSVLPRTGMEAGAQTAIVSGLGYVGFGIAGLVAITAAGLDLSSLAIVAGALSVGIGFGLRTVVENFVSGILLLIERPISEGDWIEVGGQHGIVKSISVRSTRIETFDKFDLIVPNADLISGQVRNYTRGNVLGRIIVPVGVAYGSDTRQVESILLAIARRHDQVLMNPEPYVYFAGFGADSLDFEIRAILRDVNTTLPTMTDMRHQIVRRFAEEGIQIPFPQRDVWLRNPEALRGDDRPAVEATSGAAGGASSGPAAEAETA